MLAIKPAAVFPDRFQCRAVQHAERLHGRSQQLPSTGGEWQIIPLMDNARCDEQPPDQLAQFRRGSGSVRFDMLEKRLFTERAACNLE